MMGGGPDVSGLPGRMGGAATGWSAFLSAGSSYSSAFDQPQSTGRDPVGRGFGANFGWGVNGSFSGANSGTSLSYNGNFNQGFGPAGNASFLNQALSIGHARSLDYKTSVSLFATGGEFTRVGGGTLASRPFNDFQPVTLAPGFLDTKTYFASAGGGISHRLNERSAVSAVSSYFAISRPGATMFDPRGFSLGGRYSYRLTERDSLFFGYGFSQTYFRRSVGEFNAHDVFVGWGRLIRPNLTFSMQYGQAFGNSTFAASVAIDPEIAAIIGQSTTLVLQRRDTRFWTGSAGLNYSRERWSTSVFAARGGSPGNGLIGAAVSDSAGISAAFSGTQRINFNANFNVTRLQSLSTLPGGFVGYQAGVGTTARLIGNLNAFARYDYLWNEASQTQAARRFYTASIGIAWSTNTRPIPLF